MEVLGEIGGIFGAIVGIPAIFIAYFVEKEFISAIAQLMPVKDEDGSAPSSSDDTLKNKLSEIEKTSTLPDQLSPKDAQSLANEASRIKPMPDLPGLCSKSRGAILESQKKFFEEFDSKLDIGNIVGDQITFIRFANVFLSEQ